MASRAEISNEHYERWRIEQLEEEQRVWLQMPPQVTMAIKRVT